MSDNRLYFQKMILGTQGDQTAKRNERQYLEYRAVGTSQGVFWNMEGIPLTTIIVPNLFCPIYLAMHEHWMDWVTSFHEHHSGIHKFNQLCVMMPPYPGFAPLNKPNSKVTQSSGNEIKPLGHAIVHFLAGTLLYPLASQRIPFTEALLCIKIFVHCNHMAQYGDHNEATSECMVNDLDEFHRHKHVFIWFWASKSTKKVLEALKNQLTFDKLEERENDPTWNNLSAAAKRHCVDDDKTQIESEMAQHHVDE